MTLFKLSAAATVDSPHCVGTPSLDDGGYRVRILVQLGTIAVAMALSGCVNVGDQGEQEIKEFLETTRDGWILKPFLARASSAPSARFYLGRYYLAQTPYSRPTSLRIVVSDHPGSSASPDSPFGSAMRRLASQLSANGIDARIVTPIDPYNFLIDSIPPTLGAGNGEQNMRMFAMDFRLHLRTMHPDADYFTLRKLNYSNCSRFRINLLREQTNDVARAFSTESNPPIFYAASLNAFARTEFEQLLTNAGRADADAFWIDLSIACGLNALVFDFDDLMEDEYQQRSTGRSSHRPFPYAEVGSLRDPNRKFPANEFRPPGHFRPHPIPPDIPSATESVVRAIVFMNTPILEADTPAQHLERLRATLTALRAKYDAPVPKP